jgi:hypothetical protein
VIRTKLAGSNLDKSKIKFSMINLTVDGISSKLSPSAFTDNNPTPSPTPTIKQYHMDQDAFIVVFMIGKNFLNSVGFNFIRQL